MEMISCAKEILETISCPESLLYGADWGVGLVSRTFCTGFFLYRSDRDLGLSATPVD